MGIFAEYIDRRFDWPQLEKERKIQLKRIAELRGRDILVYAGAMGKQVNVPVSISFEDRVPFFDQLSNLSGQELDIILETPEGAAEVAEDFVRVIRKKFSKVGMIVPGYAKSAGTIMVMSGDEILMEPSSALGPIDAQMFQNGKYYSAHAYLEGFKKIKEEVASTGNLNKAYIPILQNISPADLQACENAQEFSKVLVSRWLTDYKFKYWDTHKSTGVPVTSEEKMARAEEIATLLCDHQKWLTHGRSLTIRELRNDLQLEIIDYSDNKDLCEAIRRYYILLRMSFETTAIFKVFETPTSQIYRHELTQQITTQNVNSALIDFKCIKCGKITKIQARLDKSAPIEKEAVLFPQSNKFVCPHCSQEHDIIDLRRQIESQTKKKIVEG